jgi:hypothetical protein
VLVASWNGDRIPISIATIDPERTGQQNILFRQMLREFEPPCWVREIVVLGDAGYPANPTLKLIDKLGWTYVFAMPRTRKFSNGKYLRDLVQHLPKSLYRRRATYKPDGRRQDYWLFMRHAELHQLGDVTIVLSKKRRNFGPKRVKIIVTNHQGASASAIVSQYSIRWAVEQINRELKTDLGMGEHQGRQDEGRIEKSFGMALLAYLFLLRVCHDEWRPGQSWSVAHLQHVLRLRVLTTQVEHNVKTKLSKSRKAA